MLSTLFESSALWAIAGRSFVLLVVTATAALLLRRRSAAVLHGIWALGLAGCLALPLVSFTSPRWSLPVLPTTAGDSMDATQTLPVRPPARIAASAGPRRVDASLAPQTPPKPATAETPQRVKATPVRERERAASPGARLSQRQWLTFGNVVIAVWATGMLGVLLHLMVQAWRAHARLHRATDVHDPAWSEPSRLAAQRLGLRGPVPLKRYGGELTPMVIGFWQPTILLPADSDCWPAAQRQQVLLHELAHVQRRDVLTQYMATLACAVYWFNPLAWWAATQMKRLREIACDDAVVTHTGVPVDYAEMLLGVAKRYRSQSIAGAVAMARSNNVEGRIAAILSSTRSRVLLTKRTVRYLAASALVAAVMVGSCQLSSRADETPATPAEEPATESQKPTDLADSDKQSITIRLLDESGQPLAGAKVFANSVRPPDFEGERIVNQDLVADDNGTVSLPINRQQDTVKLWAWAPGMVSEFVWLNRSPEELDLQLPGEFEFRLARGSTIGGQVVDEKGHPIAGVHVRVQANDEVSYSEESEFDKKPVVSDWLTDSFYQPTIKTDEQGRWQLGNAPGPHDNHDYEFQVKLEHPGYTSDTKWGGIQREQGITAEQLRSGEAKFVMTCGTAIEGKVVGPDGKPVTNGWVVWNDESYFTQGDWETGIGEQGNFATPQLPSGEYPIIVIAPGYAAQRRVVRVEPGMAPLEFKLQPGNRIEIHIVDDQGAAIPKAGVYLGGMSGRKTWNGTNALYNQGRPGVEYGIPRKADEQGVYVWDWAPNGGVRYDIGAIGFAGQSVTLVPKSEPHVVRLAPARVAVGLVTDCETAEPIPEFLAMPVIVFGENNYATRFTDRKQGSHGRYELPLTGSGDPDVPYRVRFEADGYRSVVCERLFGPTDGRAELDVALEPMPARKGRVVDADGNPVAGALIQQASPTDIPYARNGSPNSYDARPLRTDADGNFEIRATSEPVLVRAYHDLGFAEVDFAPDEENFGELKLAPWATLSGQLLQAGRPVPNQGVQFWPNAQRDLNKPHFQDGYGALTDADGRFQFDRIPPVSGNLKAYLGLWDDSPLSSSQSVPLELRPGEHLDVVLGGEGTTLTGRVVATGRDNEQLSKQWSINYLVSRDRGVEYPAEAPPLSFNPAGPLQADWLQRNNFDTWLGTRSNYFVKLADDGQLAIHGVEPGEYDLVIQLYEEPAGCLVETIGERVVPITVTADDVAQGQVDIGDIDIECRSGPRVGSDMRAFKITDDQGRLRLVNDLEGKYVLLHAWATWCGPCIESMPALKAAVDEHSESPLVVVGLNLDDDKTAAQNVAKDQGLTWSQNYLGSESDLARQMAISTVPAYYLIGPDGKLVGSANAWQAMEKLLNQHLE